MPLNSTATFSALSGLLGVLIGGVLGHWLAIGREDRARRSAFVGELSGMRALIAQTDDLEFLGTLGKLRVDVEKECGRVQTAIGGRRRERLDVIRSDLASKKLADMQDFDNSKREFPRVMTYQAGRAIISSLLSELIKCAE
jgi:hypothetical protein